MYGKCNFCLSQLTFIVVLIIGIALESTVPTLLAQGPGGCSELEIVFRDDSGIADVQFATIAVDPGGAAHLFWLYRRDRDDPSTWVISYARWQDGIWSPPNDVLITPRGGAGAPRVVADADGILHVIWSDGDILWYANAPAQTAGNARAWTTPVSIASDALDADITLDREGRLHVVFTTGQPRGAVYYLQSLDGAIWSIPVIVYQDAPKDATSMEPRLSVDRRGRIHVTWTGHHLPGGWPPLGQWYARSEDGGSSWSTLQLSIGEQGQGAVLAVGDDQVHLVWRGTSAAGNTYHQWSTNGGRTWHGPVIFDPDGGFSGAQSLAADSAGNIHLVRSDSGYQVWQAGQWAPVPALFADAGESATLAIGLGNQVHWVSMTSVGEKTAIVWHRLCRSDSPSIPPRSLPDLHLTKTPVLVTQTPTRSPTRVANVPLNAEPGAIQPVEVPLIVGVLPTLVLLTIVILMRGSHHDPRGD